MERIVVKANDVELECFSVGEGTPIVLLPGGSLTVDHLSGLADAIAAAGSRAISVDFRGAGDSVGPMEGLTLHDYAADVARVIEELDLAPAFVLGHAYGNRIARTVAADRPELVRGVILVAAGGKIDSRPRAQQALRTLFTPTASTSEVLDAMKWMVGSPESAAAVWETFKAARAPGAAAAQMKAALATPLEDWWTSPGDTPYLVIQGLKDEAAPAENGHLLQMELGDRVTVVDLPDVGHLQPIEAPGSVAAAVIDFTR